MARIDSVAIRQEAEREEKAGHIDKAMGLYRQLVADNPDWDTVRKVGELCSRIARRDTRPLRRDQDGGIFLMGGDGTLRMIAVLKQFQKRDPIALDVNASLGELYSMQGLMVEAKGQYKILFDEYMKLGRIQDACPALCRMVEIDPDDLGSQSTLADLYAKVGNGSAAIDVHITIAHMLIERSRLAEALQELEQAARIDPESSKVQAELARAHLIENNRAKAVPSSQEGSSGRTP